MLRALGGCCCSIDTSALRKSKYVDYFWLLHKIFVRRRVHTKPPRTRTIPCLLSAFFIINTIRGQDDVTLRRCSYQSKSYVPARRVYTEVSGETVTRGAKGHAVAIKNYESHVCLVAFLRSEFIIWTRIIHARVKFNVTRFASIFDKIQHDYIMNEFKMPAASRIKKRSTAYAVQKNSQRYDIIDNRVTLTPQLYITIGF